MNLSYITTIISSTIPWKMWKNYDNRAIHVEKKKISAICESMQMSYHVQELERQKIIIIRRKRNIA